MGNDLYDRNRGCCPFLRKPVEALSARRRIQSGRSRSICMYVQYVDNIDNVVESPRNGPPSSQHVVYEPAYTRGQVG
jgi:hypothetical protein